MTTFSQVLESMPNFTPAQLAELAARAAALKPAARVSPGRNRQPEVSTAYAVMSGEIKKYGATPIPWPALVRQSYFGAFRDTVPALHEYINQNFKPANEAERSKALRIIVGLAVEHVAKHARSPLSSRTATGALTNFGGIIERQFPGYRSAGLLPVLVGGFRSV